MRKTIILIIRLLAIICCLVIIAFSSKELLEYNKGKEAARNLRVRVVTPLEVPEKENLPPISVDFDALVTENSDTVAWLYSADTPINYPIVQSDDNDYYLRRGFNGKYNYYGTLFADYRTSGDFSGKNTLIYGHNMKNAEMFGSLINYKEQEYFDKHPQMWLFTPSGNYMIKLVAGIEVPGTSEIFDTLANPDEAEKVIRDALLGSTFKADYTYSETDRFVTLSTCSYDYADARYIVIGRLNEIL
mgnify:CR=1 FL=1